MKRLIRAVSSLSLLTLMGAIFLVDFGSNEACAQGLRPPTDRDLDPLDRWREKQEERTRRFWQEAEEQRKIERQELNKESSKRLIVMVSGKLDDGPTIGAGIVFGRDKDKLYVVTANHVVRRGTLEARDLRVKFRQLPDRPLPDRPLEARLLNHFDQEQDVAVISVEGLAAQGVDLCAIDFAQLEHARYIKRGDAVYPVGNPNGVEWGMPMTAERVAEVVKNRVNFQSTFISAGHSGGGLLNERGNLVGMIQKDQPPYGSAISLSSIVQTLRGWGYIVELMENAPWSPYRELLENGRSRPSIGGLSFLHAAAANGDAKTVQHLLAACGDANARDTFGWTPLHWAVMHRQVEMVKLLIAARADVNAMGYRATPTLLLAASEGQVEIIQLLLLHGANVNSKGALGAAASEGHADAVKVLLAHGANVNADDALHAAARSGHAETVGVLLAGGANVNAKNVDGETALIIAAYKGRTRIVRALLERGARVNEKDRNGWTALHHVEYYPGDKAKAEIARLLKQAGAE